MLNNGKNVRKRRRLSSKGENKGENIEKYRKLNSEGEHIAVLATSALGIPVSDILAHSPRRAAVSATLYQSPAVIHTMKRIGEKKRRLEYRF